jgi:hypothetical protein
MFRCLTAFDLINDKVESSSEGSPRLTSPTTSDRDTDGSVAADLALLYNNKDYSDCKIASTKDDTTFHGYRYVFRFWLFVFLFVVYSQLQLITLNYLMLKLI